MPQSVHRSVRSLFRPSITPFSLCSHHRIIMKFSGVITNDISDVHAKDRGQRWKVKVKEDKTQFSRFRTVTPVRIHIGLWNYAHTLMWVSRGILLFSKVICQIRRSQGTKIVNFDPNWAFWTVTPFWIEWCTNIEVAQKRCSIVFQGHPGDKKSPCSACNSSFNSLIAKKWCTKLVVA